MTKPGPSVTSGADIQPGSNSLFPSGFGGGSIVRAGGVGSLEIADGSVGLVDLAAEVKATIPLTTPAVSTATTGTLAVGTLNRIDANSVPLARTLPSAATAGAGGIVVVKKTDATSNAVSVTASGSDTINVSGSTRTLTLPREAAHFRSDGVSDWTVVASDTPVAQLDSRYDARYVTPATGNATYARRGSLDVADYGVTPGGDATANSTGFAAALAAAAASGGLVAVSFRPSASPYQFASPWNLDGARGLTIRSAGVGVVDPGFTKPVDIQFTGTGTTPQVSAKNSSGVTFKGLSLRYTSSSLTGYFIDASGTLAVPTSMLTFEDCVLGGVGVVASAQVICLRGVVGADFNRVFFYGGVNAVVGLDSDATTFSNEVAFRRCAFNGFSGASILNPGTGWGISDRTFFEPTTGLTAAAISLDASHNSTNLTIRDSGFWDVTGSGGGTWIDYRGGQGLLVSGCRFDLGSAATAINLRSGAGIQVTGNAVSGSSGATFLASVSSVTDLLEEGNYVPSAVTRQSGLFTRTNVPTAVRTLLNTDAITKWDTFLRTDNGANLGNSDDGNAWGTQSQRWAVTSGWAYCPGSAGYAVVTKNGTLADGMVRAMIRMGDTTFGDLVFRSNSASTSFLVLHLDGTNAKIQSRVSGTPTDLASTAYPAYAQGTYLIELFFTKNRVAARINGETAVAVTLGSSDQTTFGSNTYHGLGVDLSGGAGSVAARFLDWAYTGF